MTTAVLEAEQLRREVEQLVVSLPKQRVLLPEGISKYQGFWYPSKFMSSIIFFQRYFQARDAYIILASMPKSGTTWLKALLFSIINRQKFDLSTTPLLTSNPHQLVPFLEFDLYGATEFPNIESIPSPRLFSTHIPFSSLPDSIKQSDCKIVYVCRNPFDVIVSSWHFLNAIQLVNNHVNLSLDELFELFCEGVHGYGPFWNHVLHFWNDSLENPKKVLFLKYEDLKGDPIFQLKKLAEFLGFPFSMEEEKNGVIDEIMNMCSFGTLKGLEVNKSGRRNSHIENKLFFRNGEVGDWVNFLSPSMVDSLRKIIDEKFSDSGFTF